LCFLINEVVVTIDASPTARALLALELLQGNPGVTADRLAERLGVSPRAVRRYVAILREAGIPVVAVRGPGGGYRLGRGLRLPPLLFSAAEALGLVMAVLDGHHDAGDPTVPVGGALGKIMRALPEAVAAQAEAVRASAAPTPDRAAARPDPQITVALVQARADQRRVRLHYRTETGSELVVEAEPWSVVIRHGRWYLLCWSLTSSAVRTYRVDRVQAVESLEATFTPPTDLDPVRMVEEHLSVGWEYAVDVTVEAPAETLVGCIPRALGRLEAVDAETSRLVATTSNPQWYAEQLASIPAAYRIVAGPQLREATRVLGRRLLAATQPP
jgi:predicted DNA-binding transcriptional regulator YafY